MTWHRQWCGTEHTPTQPVPMTVSDWTSGLSDSVRSRSRARPRLREREHTSWYQAANKPSKRKPLFVFVVSTAEAAGAAGPPPVRAAFVDSWWLSWCCMGHGDNDAVNLPGLYHVCCVWLPQPQGPEFVLFCLLRTEKISSSPSPVPPVFRRRPVVPPRPLLLCVNKIFLFLGR